MKEKDFLTFTDEDGVDRTYELIDECVINGKTYVAISPAEYYVLKKVKSEKKEDTYETIEGDELESVSEIFDARINIVDHDKK